MYPTKVNHVVLYTLISHGVHYFQSGFTDRNITVSAVILLTSKTIWETMKRNIKIMTHPQIAILEKET